MTVELNEPNFIERDPEKITQDLIAIYEEKTGKKLQPAQIERAIIDMIAYESSLVRIGIQEAAKQNLVDFARKPMLDYLGSLLGVSRNSAQPARTTCRASIQETLAFNITIPSGTKIESKDGKVIFKTLSSVIITAGTLNIDVLCEAETPGIIGNNYLPGEINNLLSPIQYIYSFENISTTSGGSDEESDDNLRKRIKIAPESFSNAGSKEAYRFWALTAHQDIVDVAITSPSAGTVNIYPLMKDGIPESETLSKVSETLNDEKIRPLTDLVQVLAPTEVSFSISANVTLYTSADQTAINEQINNVLNEYTSNISSSLGKDIVTSQIISLINNIEGVYSVELTQPASQVLNRTQFAKNTGITITFQESVDG